MNKSAQITLDNVAAYLENSKGTVSTQDLVDLCNVSIEDVRSSTREVLALNIGCGMLINDMATVTSNFDINFDLDEILTWKVAEHIAMCQNGGLIVPPSEAFEIVMGDKAHFGTRQIDSMEENEFRMFTQGLHEIARYTQQYQTDDALRECYLFGEACNDDDDLGYSVSGLSLQIEQLQTLKNKERAKLCMQLLFTGVPLDMLSSVPENVLAVIR